MTAGYKYSDPEEREEIYLVTQISNPLLLTNPPIRDQNEVTCVPGQSENRGVSPCFLSSHHEGLLCYSLDTQSKASADAKYILMMDLGLEGDERVESFIKRQKELLDLEKVAHAKRDIQELREHGDTLLVELVSTSEPKYGGTIVKFKPRQTKNSKKAPTFRGGCMVGVDFGSEMFNGILVNVKIATFEH